MEEHTNHISNIHWENETAISPKFVRIQIAEECLLSLIQLRSLKADRGERSGMRT